MVQSRHNNLAIVALHVRATGLFAYEVSFYVIRWPIEIKINEGAGTSSNMYYHVLWTQRSLGRANSIWEWRWGTSGSSNLYLALARPRKLDYLSSTVFCASLDLVASPSFFLFPLSSFHFPRSNLFPVASSFTAEFVFASSSSANGKITIPVRWTSPLQAPP